MMKAIIILLFGMLGIASCSSERVPADRRYDDSTYLDIDSIGDYEVDTIVP